MMNEVNVIEEKFTRCPQCRSFSVKKTDANFIERIKDRFVPVTVQFCNNCSYRFAEYGKFSVTYKKNWLLVVIPLVVVAALVAVFLSTGGTNTTLTGPADQKPPVKDTADITPPTNTPPDTKTTEDKTEEVTETGPPPVTPPTTEEDKETTEETTKETPETKPEITIENEIVLGNSNRFGVNWSPVENGVRITRLSPGSLKNAGLQLGDVFTEIDGNKIITGNLLLRIRNEIFNERRGAALITVYRNDVLFYYKLVKRPGQEPEPSTQPRETTSPPPDSEPPADVPPAAQNKPLQAPVKVFRAGTIKKRSSAPDSESPAHRWCYLNKKITVKRETNQKVYVSGDASGTKNWGVDDRLVINGKIFKGLSRSYKKISGPLPETCKNDPLDITDLVPPGRDFSLLVELEDHGIQWANTDIYIVVK